MKKASDEIKGKAIALYNEGKSANEISKIIAFNESTIRMWIKKSGIEIRKGGFYNKKYSDDVIEEIKKLYSEKYYTSEIDELLNLRKGTAQYILNKENVQLRHPGPKSKIGNEEFFKEINNEKKAYFLGYIIADGNISLNNNQYSLKFHIALKDKSIIDKFLECIESNNKTNIKENNGNKSYYVSLTSKVMCNDLINLGVIPNKTGREYIPKIPSELVKHFLRGFFDGDGITDISRRRSGFVGSEKIINQILVILNENLKTHYCGKNKLVKYFLGGIKFSVKLYQYLYKDATVCLERKKIRLEKIAFNDGTPYEVKVSRRV